jgi:hypothetical protein
MTIETEHRMAFWNGRKSAPELRPFVPAWLTGEAETGGFVRGVDGMSLVDSVSGQLLNRREGAWETGIVRAREVRVDGLTVVRDRQSAIGDPSGGAVVDSECRIAVAQMLAALRAHGLIG